MGRRIFIVAGEASGDLHAARLVRELCELHPDWRFVGFGGERMRAAGVQLRANLVDRAIMGVSRVVREIGGILSIVGSFIEEIQSTPPDLLVLVDYPGLNLNLARIARDRGIPVVYYVCPQVWAWAPWRLRRIARRADLLLVIIPFERELFAARHPRVEYVGNPVFDHLAEFERMHPRTASSFRRLAILPGSRRQEIEGSLPMLLAVARRLVAHEPDLHIEVSCHRPDLRAFFERCIRDAGVQAGIVDGPAQRLQQGAHLALVVSGTATLEQAWFGAPLVVVYPARGWQQRVFSWFRVTPFIALVNLFAGRLVVPELLFAPHDEERIYVAARELLDGPAREQAIADLAALRQASFQPGASRRAALAIERFLFERSAASPAQESLGAPAQAASP